MRMLVLCEWMVEVKVIVWVVVEVYMVGVLDSGVRMGLVVFEV